MSNKIVEATIKEQFLSLNKQVLQNGLTLSELQEIILKTNANKNVFSKKCVLTALVAVILYGLFKYDCVQIISKQSLGVRCIIPNNYFIWEATRPVSDCEFCVNVTRPIVLHNVTKDEFSQYSYSSKPIVIKKASLHWPAMTVFDFQFFKNLYNNITSAYASVDDECQFLHFQSNFISLRDVFSMSEARSNRELEQSSWYVGWGNCDPDVLSEMHKYYPKPHFLPDDSEISLKEYVFMGYDAGATMHLDFINRLMWQAQLKGKKLWNLKPSPECESLCDSFSFIVEPGDADTRVWYHGTTIFQGEFSLSVQSEYG